MSVIAIVGAGPRGIAALQSLFAAAPPNSTHTVYIFGARDTHGALIAGWGSAYAPDQADYIRLNANADIVDLWRHERATTTHSIAAALPHDSIEIAGDQHRPSFRCWATMHAPRWAAAEFPPRALIGAYYQHCYQLLTDRIPDGWRLIEMPPLSAIHRGNAAQWELEAGACTITADEVLLAVGHAQANPDPLCAKAIDAGDIPCVPHPYPLTRLDSIQPAARVAVRGAGLSFIDVALQLTEGRGGRFVDDPTSPTSLRYQPSGNEVATLRPIAREGRFAEAKPPADLLHQLCHQGELARVQELITKATSLERICQIIERVLTAVALRGGFPHSAIDDLLAGTSPAPGAAAASLLTSVHVAQKIHPPTFASYAGSLWAHIGDALVPVVSHTLWPKGDWERYQRLANACSPYAYGPPPLGAQKIATLIDAGVIDCSWLDGGVQQQDIGRLHRQGANLDVVIDAVLAPPGWWQGAYPALSAIDEYLSLWSKFGAGAVRTGVRVDECGRVMSAINRPVTGLAAIGRMTSNWVLSNDTLNRDVHDHPQNWAQWVLTGNDAPAR